MATIPRNSLMQEHRRHVLFAGTKLLTSSASASATPAFSGVPADACVAVVLRTGFETAQGKLVRTIVHTADRVSANSPEAFLFGQATPPQSHLPPKGLRSVSIRKILLEVPVTVVQ